MVLNSLCILGTEVKLRSSAYDVVIAGFMEPSCFLFDDDVLTELAKVLKPSGKLLLKEPVSARKDSLSADELNVLKKIFSPLVSAPELQANAKLAGFVEVTMTNSLEIRRDPSYQVVVDFLSSRYPGVDVQACLMGVDFVVMTCMKPAYEVGAVSQLKLGFNKKKLEGKQQKKTTAQVWQVSAGDDENDDDDLFDDDDFLGEEDLVKPDPESLKSNCATRKKACKNCTCGRADMEMEEESGFPKPEPVSSCGSVSI